MYALLIIYDEAYVTLTLCYLKYNFFIYDRKCADLGKTYFFFIHSSHKMSP